METNSQGLLQLLRHGWYSHVIRDQNRWLSILTMSLLLQVSKAARQEKKFQDYNERCTFHHQAKVAHLSATCPLAEKH